MTNKKTINWHRDRNKSQPITRMVWLIAFGSPDSFTINDIHYAKNSITTYQILCALINPAAKTTSIGLPASPDTDGNFPYHRAVMVND